MTAHTAIVPTAPDAPALSGADAQVYGLIAARAVSVFMPPERYQSVSISVSVGDDVFTARGKVVIDAGWTAVMGASEDDEGGGAVLPDTKPGVRVEVGRAEVVAGKTKPLPRMTDGSLIDAMANVHKFVDSGEAREKLRETAGIGTEATRAKVIETLLKRGWVMKQGKQLVSTTEGRSVIAALPARQADPVATADLESDLSRIAAGDLPLVEFERKIVAYVSELVTGAVGVAGIAKPGTAGGTKFTTAPCPVCGAMARRMESKNKPGVHFWACENKGHGLMADEKGKPGALFKPR